jgi:hypothetical protein
MLLPGKFGFGTNRDSVGPLGNSIGSKASNRQTLAFRSGPNSAPRSAQGLGLSLFVLVLSLVGLYRFSLNVAELAGAAPASERPGAGIYVRTWAKQVWLPGALITSADDPISTRSFATHKELQDFLEQNQFEELWYAITIRGQLASGVVEELTLIRWPYAHSAHSEELRQLLTIAAGKPAADSHFANMEIRVIPSELLKMNPREAMAELLSHVPDSENSWNDANRSIRNLSEWHPQFLN